MKTRALFLVALGVLPALASADPSPTGESEAAACRNLASPLVEAEIQRAIQANRHRYRDVDEQYSMDEAGGGGGIGDSVDRAPPAPTSAPSMEPAPTPPKEDAAARASERRTASRGAGKAASGPANYSRTNTQEDSVDEGDIVKTNGRVVYHVSCSRDREASACRNEIRIYSSWPAHESRLLARYEIPVREAQPRVQQIYLFEDQVAILMNGAGTAARVLLLDVTTPASPRLARELEIDGGLIESRMIGSRLYLATTTPLQLPAALVHDIHTMVAQNPGQSPRQIFAALLPKWSAALERDPGLPRARERGSSWNEPAQAPIYRCSDVSLGSTIGGTALLNLVQLDLADNRSLEGAGVSGYSAQSTVYASEGSFYVAAPAIPERPGWSTATLIRKFSLGRGGKPSFDASGQVRGHVLNQFAFSEHQGNLRVATSDQWTSNNLYVLRAKGAHLETIGTLENLGQNERIYAVRMMGDRGYVVTFRRTDPLYTLDLSEPTRPAMIGELKIEGYSNYLHPLGNNHLLAIGQDADQWGRPTGLHLQIFDVADPRHPTRKFHEKLAAGTTSDAQTDHHAFMFEPETNTLSVPWRSQNYWGLLAYRVDPRDGFVNLGRVNHALMYKQHFQKQCAKADVAECGKSNYWYNFVTRPAIAVDRIIAIDEQLYSLSPSGLMVHKAKAGLPLTTAVLVTPPAWKPTSSPVASR